MLSFSLKHGRALGSNMDISAVGFFFFFGHHISNNEREDFLYTEHKVFAFILQSRSAATATSFPVLILTCCSIILRPAVLVSPGEVCIQPSLGVGSQNYDPALRIIASVRPHYHDNGVFSQTKNTLSVTSVTSCSLSPTRQLHIGCSKPPLVEHLKTRLLSHTDK